MQSTGPSEGGSVADTYVDLCRGYIMAQLPRLGSSGQSLRGLERAVRGHEDACWRLGLAGWTECFSDRFGRWLSAKAGVEMGAGWAVAVEVAARKANRPAAALFSELSREFLVGWTPEPSAPRVAELVIRTDYRTSTAMAIKAVIRRPGMYYSRLSELADIFHGLAAAFEQCGLIKHDERFARKFSTWLKRERGANVRRGWVRGIEGLARTSGQTVDATFAECATAFLEDWLAEPPAVPMPGPAP